MYALNRAKIIGYLTEKAELRQLPTGASVCDINLRCISKEEREGAKIDVTSFHTVTFWGKMAENIAQYTDTGSQIYIEGRLQTDSWDGEDGKKRYKTKIIGEDMVLLTPQNGGYPAVQSAVFGTGINTVELIGNLTKDLEVRQTPTGRSVGSTSVATNRKWRDRNTEEMREETEFHNIVIWNELATEGETQLKKGRKVFVQGRLQTRSWETPEGTKRYTTEVIAENISLLGSESPVDMNGGNAAENTSSTSTPAAESKPTPPAEEVPPVPSIQYESEIKPEDLPF
jgi:single-strand DNA-binding protein